MRKLATTEDGKGFIVEMTNAEWQAFERLRAAAENDLPDDFLEVPSMGNYDMEKALVTVWLWVHMKFKLLELQRQLDLLKLKLEGPEE